LDGTPNIVSKARGSSGIGMAVSIDNRSCTARAGAVPSGTDGGDQAESRPGGDVPWDEGDRTV
jgi:hypothetical protein